MTTTSIFQRITYGIAAAVCLLAASCTCAGQIARDITMYNESGSRIEINWVNPDDGTRVLQTSPYLYAGATHNLNSYASHRFEVKELPSSTTHKCRNGAEGPSNPDLCGVAFFTVNDRHDQIFYIREGMHIQHDDHRSLAVSRTARLLEECETGTLDRAGGGGAAEGMVGDMARCIEEKLGVELDRQEEESDFQSGVRLDMAGLLATYACGDVGMKGTEPERVERFSLNGRGGRGKHMMVNVVHDRPGSRVHVLQNFVTEAECRAMEQGLPNFGGGMRSSSRSSSSSATASPSEPSGTTDTARILQEDIGDTARILQEDIGIPWEKENDGNPVTDVSRRILDYTNHVLGLNIEEHGQEGLTSIQYAGNPPPNTPSGGTDGLTTARYEPVNATPHCGEECLGKPHRVGQRIAGIVMYCGVPNKKSGGGATNFHKLGAHHVPTALSAMWFSYMDPETFEMDGEGYTEHTECPVLKGEKRIVRQWIRHGVHKDLPWHEYEHETAEITMMVTEDDDEREL